MNKIIQKSRLAEATNEIERLWGAAYVKSALAELIRGERHEEDEQVTFKELFTYRYRKGRMMPLFSFRR